MKIKTTKYQPMLLNKGITGISKELNLFIEAAKKYGVNHALAEFAARVCYKSTGNMGNSPTFLKNKIVDVNHMDVFEHHYATVWFESGLLDTENNRPEYKYIHSHTPGKLLDTVTASDRVLLSLGFDLTQDLSGIYGAAKIQTSWSGYDHIWGEYVRNNENVTLLAYEQNLNRFAWLLEGISIFTATQITRHRVGSFSQQSARYVSLEKGGWEGIIPPAFSEEQAEILEEFYALAGEKYQELKSLGAKNEDARCVFPVGFTTRMVLSFDDKGLNHFLNLRLPRAAQWEIRKIAVEMNNQQNALRTI